jgi:hypothetical protein
VAAASSFGLCHVGLFGDFLNRGFHCPTCFISSSSWPLRPQYWGCYTDAVANSPWKFMDFGYDCGYQQYHEDKPSDALSVVSGQMRVHLNGWQRLWVVVSALSFGVATLLAYSAYRTPTRVEDAQILAQLNEDEVTDVDIPGLGRVKFPNDMPTAEIEALIRDNFDKNLVS